MSNISKMQQLAIVQSNHQSVITDANFIFSHLLRKKFIISIGLQDHLKFKIKIALLTLGIMKISFYEAGIKRREKKKYMRYISSTHRLPHMISDT